ncbi:MAG: UDP-4-amino-4,6-dideoxy-N-acetyl-beta-L-altrosamine transaminase [Alphaproteobacteria bacterium]
MLQQIIGSHAEEPSRTLPYGRHFIDEDDIAAVAGVLRGDYLTTGPAVEDFERALASATGAREAVALANGTAALHLAARALGLGPGDTVIVPAITFVATANAARFVGAEVVFADVDPDSGLHDAEHCAPRSSWRGGGGGRRRRTTSGKRALFNVHLAGQCEDLEEIARIAREAGLLILDDACHAIGTEYRTMAGKWHKVGSCAHSDLTVFSFHPVKTIAMGEGGAIALNNSALAAHIRRDRSHGLERDPALLSASFSRDLDGAPAPWAYELVAPGYNYRASDIHCALAASQLKKLSKFVRERRALMALYERMLEPLWPVVRPLSRVAACLPAWHLNVALVDFARAGTTRTALMGKLKARGIGTQVHYIPVHRQPYYEDRYGAQDLPGAEVYYRNCLTLPLFVGLSEDDVARVCDALAELAAG